jgi:predicted amidophosphoribosyltransferase
VKCCGCGKSTGMSNGVCLPCQVGLKSVKGAAQVFGRVCARCGLPLTSLESRRRGYGPECWQKVGVPWYQIPLPRSRFARDAGTVTEETPQP